MSFDQSYTQHKFIAFLTYITRGERRGIIEKKALDSKRFHQTQHYHKFTESKN